MERLLLQPYVSGSFGGIYDGVFAGVMVEGKVESLLGPYVLC